MNPAELHARDVSPRFAATIPGLYAVKNDVRDRSPEERQGPLVTPRQWMLRKL